MTTNSFAHTRRSLPRVVLCVALATACESAPPPTSPSSSQSPSPVPAPTPPLLEYRVSGIVTDAANAAAIANVIVTLRYNQGELTTRTGSDGAYVFSFNTSGPYQSRFSIVPGDVLALLTMRDGAYSTDVSGGHWTTVQSLPWGTREVAHNVRMRPVRALAPGESMRLSIESDSSLLWEKDWDPWQFPSFDTLEEEFLVSVQTDGVLTLDVRPEAGGNVARLSCHYGGCPPVPVQAETISIPVKADRSTYYFSVQIPRASAPQRYEIRASLR